MPEKGKNGKKKAHLFGFCLLLYPLCILNLKIHIKKDKIAKKSKNFSNCSLGPCCPSKCRTRVASVVCSQSSMNSQSCMRPISFESGDSFIMAMIHSTIAFLYSKPPSSRSILAKCSIITECFRGYFLHNAEIASTRV